MRHPWPFTYAPGRSRRDVDGTPATRERREVIREIQTGSADVVVGTHALIQEGVEYHRLGLVITDEQHRFGVKQRARLRKKGSPRMFCS